MFRKKEDPRFIQPELVLSLFNLNKGLSFKKAEDYFDFMIAFPKLSQQAKFINSPSEAVNLFREASILRSELRQFDNCYRLSHQLAFKLSALEAQIKQAHHTVLIGFHCSDKNQKKITAFLDEHPSIIAYGKTTTRCLNQFFSLPLRRALIDEVNTIRESVIIPLSKK